MFYAICEGFPGSSGPAYIVYKFPTLESMKPCEAVNEYSIIYNGDSHRQLIDFCSLEELIEIATCLCIAFTGTEEVKFVSLQQAADYVHSVVVKKAKLWKPEKESDMSTVHVDQFNNKAQKAEKEVRPRFEKTTKIVSLMVDPPIRSGTNRYRNMQVVLASQTVGEAISALRKLDPAPGGRMDLRIAVKAGAIKIDNPHFQPLGEK